MPETAVADGHQSPHACGREANFVTMPSDVFRPQKPSQSIKLYKVFLHGGTCPLTFGYNYQYKSEFRSEQARAPLCKSISYFTMGLNGSPYDYVIHVALLPCAHH